MPKKSNKDDFVKKSRVRHGDFYGYNDFVYVNSKIKGTIICPIHGPFQMTPNQHLAGHGCLDCASERNGIKKRSLVVGVGIYDGSKDDAYSKCKKLWNSMLLRCYKKNHPCYLDVYVCSEWLTFSNFKKWFDENYIEGYDLDKDILVKGNKVYSPDTCCFVPPRINVLVINSPNNNGLPKGVRKYRFGDGYIAECNLKGRRRSLGIFKSPNEAFQAYKQAKESYVKEVAQEYYDRDKIAKKVYDALMRYEVEISD